MVIFVMLGFIMMAVNSLRIAFWNNQCRKDAYLHNRKTYQGYGSRRTVLTNKTVYEKYNPVTRKTELIHGYGKTKEIIDSRRPLSKEAHALANKRYAIEQGYSMYEYDWDQNRKISEHNNGIVGNIYADSISDEKYVIRTVGGRFYYVNINTGQILRETKTSKIQRKAFPGWKGEPYDFKLNKSTYDQMIFAKPQQSISKNMDFYSDCKPAPNEYYEKELKRLKEGSRW